MSQRAEMKSAPRALGRPAAVDVPAEPRRRWWPDLWLLLPALAFLAVFFAYPMLDILFRSLAGPAGPSLAQYRWVAAHPIYLRVFWITFQIAAATTVLTLLLGYPLAYALSSSRGLTAALLMLCIVIPFFTDILVRTYAWMVILGPTGVLNQMLRAAGAGPVTLLYNRYGVLIGMTYALLPYMTLTLYSVMRGIDSSLLRAARSLGAGDWPVFRRVYLPLTLPGVAGGSLLVFILALGYFITPRLLGGMRDQMIAMVIEQQVELALNWRLASALAIILLAVTIVGFVLYDRLIGLRSLFESKTP
jgi:putative spermidine/putrescine transport system permease protein